MVRLWSATAQCYLVITPTRWVVGCEMPSGMIFPELNASR